MYIYNYTYNLVSLVSNWTMTLPSSGTNSMQIALLFSSWLTRDSQTGDWGMEEVE